MFYKTCKDVIKRDSISNSMNTGLAENQDDGTEEDDLLFASLLQRAGLADTDRHRRVVALGAKFALEASTETAGRLGFHPDCLKSFRTAVATGESLVRFVPDLFVWADFQRSR